eukprot:GHVR01139757.1.p1 GENE.GHVR01139757.1~~GHVR01139757.1.p1  ORF type:complete len:109 (+),score=22.20 GHVR01139757.1:130-456(+)
MVYLDNFDEFQLASWVVYCNRPTQTRCQVKYRHSDQKLVVKVTDDRSCVKFKTDQQCEMRQVERFSHQWLMWSVSPTDKLHSTQMLMFTDETHTAGHIGGQKKKKKRA